MAAGATRDDTALRGGLETWFAQAFADREEIRVDDLRRAPSGWSTETLIVDVAWRGGSERLVVRLPTLTPSFPSPALREQACVLGALATSSLPVPRVVAVEDDARWVGAPFLVMSFVAGRPVGEVPALDPWLTDAPMERQRRVHEAFLRALSTLHRVDWRAARLGETLRVGVHAEIDYWLHYVDWAADGSPARALVGALEWCKATVPIADVPSSLLWGDARLGNVMFDSDGTISSLVDWELATIGPAEMDLAWYLALDELTTSFIGRTVPGFLGREELIEFYARELGRDLVHLEWHEVFALARSVAVNDCQARLATAAGTPYPGVAGDDNPLLPHLRDRIASFYG
jgi:aminoglycoside phosphotransferase (APT) family kinase protein